MTEDRHWLWVVTVALVAFLLVGCSHPCETGMYGGQMFTYCTDWRD